MNPVIQYTRAGLAELISAKNRGMSGAITHISAGDRSYTPSASQSQLYNERQRVRISDYEDVSDTQIRLAALFDGSAEYEVREIGIWLESGTLLGVYSEPNQLLAYKSANANWLQKLTIDISPLPTSSVTIDVSNENVNLLIAEELATCTAAFVLSQAANTEIILNQFTLSEKLRNA